MKDLKELLDQLKFYTRVIAEEDFDPENHDLADEVERRSPTTRTQLPKNFLSQLFNLLRFINSVIKLCEVITGMFTNLEIVCNSKMTPTQAKFFAKIRSKVNPALDISIQYFGLDWKVSFQRQTNQLINLN